MQLTFWTEEPLADDEPEGGESVYRDSVWRAGQYLAAAELELAGFCCSLASEGLPYDLIAGTSDGALCRVQVKSSLFATMHNRRTLAYRFGRGRRQRKFNEYQDVADVFAFVAMDKRAVTFVRTCQVRTAGIEIPASAFDDPNLRALSLTQAMATVAAPSSSGDG